MSATFGNAVWERACDCADAGPSGERVRNDDDHGSGVAELLRQCDGQVAQSHYTAAAVTTAGMNNGQLTITVPTGWTTPTVVNTTSTKGTVSVAGQVITVSNLDLAASGTVDITYSGVTVGSTTGTGISFAVQQKSWDNTYAGTTGTFTA